MVRETETILVESWRRALAGIDTLLGRLVYLAGLRNVNTGLYEHFGLSERAGADAADRLIRRAHMETFRQWLSLGLPQQRVELETYFSGLEADRLSILLNWLNLTPYAVWVPAETLDVERKLFYTDLEAVLEMIRGESGVVSPDPDS